MQAIGFTKHLPITNEESLMAFNLPSPKPKPHDLCVQVTAVSVNPVDAGVRKGGRGQSKTPRILAGTLLGLSQELAMPSRYLNRVIVSFMLGTLNDQVVIANIN